MKNHHLLAYAMSTPWALMPERMAAYAAVLARHYAGGASGDTLPQAPVNAAAADMLAEMQARVGGGSSGGGSSNGIALVPVMGAIVEWPHQIDMCDGGTSTRQISRALDQAEADSSVGHIVMVFGTPGGSVYGVQELGDQINRIKSRKPIIGVAQSLSASAGYWLMAQCSEAYCTPSGEVGSIGVYSGHEDMSKALEMAGVSIELFSAGEYKTEGHPFGPMTQEGKDYQMKRAQDYYATFTKAVAKGRSVPIEAVRNGMGKGRVLSAQDALAENMIDGIATLEEVLSRIQKPVRSSRSANAARFAADIAAVS